MRSFPLLNSTGNISDLSPLVYKELPHSINKMLSTDSFLGQKGHWVSCFSLTLFGILDHSIALDNNTLEDLYPGLRSDYKIF